MDVQLSETDRAYLLAFKGTFTSALRWHHLDALWDRLSASADAGWFIYHVGEAPPEVSVDGEKLIEFIKEIDKLLHKEHDEDYCGIVYADDLNAPSFIKIYDPNNLGVTCGYSDNPPLPGWVLSQMKPCDVPASQKPTNSRKRWWKALFGG